MDIKIKNSININGFSGPSQNYYETKERFKAILETKLNIPTVEVPGLWQLHSKKIVEAIGKALFFCQISHFHIEYFWAMCYNIRDL